MQNDAISVHCSVLKKWQAWIGVVLNNIVLLLLPPGRAKGEDKISFLNPLLPLTPSFSLP